MNPPIRPDISDPKHKPDSGAKGESSSVNVKPDPNLLPPEPEHTTPEPAALRIANAVPPKKTTTTNLTRASVFETGMGTGPTNPAQGAISNAPNPPQRIPDVHAAQKNPTPTPPQKVTGVHPAPNIA